MLPHGQDLLGVPRAGARQGSLSSSCVRAGDLECTRGCLSRNALRALPSEGSLWSVPGSQRPCRAPAPAGMSGSPVLSQLHCG